MNSVVVQTAIGLVFVFAVFSVFVSIITEAISRFIGLRGEYLLRGLRTMLDGGGHFTLMPQWVDRMLGRPPVKTSANNSAHEMAKAAAKSETAADYSGPWVTKIVNHWLVQVSSPRATVPDAAGNAKLSRKQRRELPSYISGEVFAQALIDLVVPDSEGRTTMDQVRAKLGGLPPLLSKQLTALAGEAENDIAAFRRRIAGWYDAHMDRVSGWYKRHTRWISLGIGAVLVVLFNLNVFAIGRELYTDQGVRAAIVRQAAHATQCHAKSAKTCLGDVEQSLNNAELAGLPIGWHTVTACAPTARKSSSHKCTNVFERTGLIGADFSFWHNVGVFLLVLAGWLLMVVALLPGARFWFDLLGRLGSLRSTGPKPPRTSAATAA
jgi:hypothetical protein